MKLSDVRPNVETSGDLEEQFFSIEDQGMIFDILRNKMYSNPILAICREITCNARDAHREVRTPEVAVHIHLPNALEPYYKIKDFGPGISPDRMSNIFIKYTASTKRQDNVQTGGFGLGAKTPFSYSDSFSITTNVNGTQYHYTCFIDETRVGKLALTHEAPTTEANGTEIQIPVLPKNFTEFATWTEQACRQWEVKPVIKGGEIKWQETKTILEGTNWAIASSDSWNRTAKMIIDGIEYPLEIDTLRKYADSKLIDASRGHFILYFGVGELSLSASREQIYLDEKTQGVIRERLNAIYGEIKQRVVDKVESFPNLWDANIYYRKELKMAFSNLNFLGKLSWHGVPLHDEYMYVECPIFHFSKGKSTRRGSDPNKITRSSVRHFSFEEESECYINDLPLREPTPRHVKKAFEDNPKLTVLQVICPNDKMTIQDLDTKIQLNLMAPKKLSSITKASARAYTPATSRLLVFKFDNQSCGFRQVSYASVEEDANDKVLCLLSKENYPTSRQIILKNKQNLSSKTLKTLLERNSSVSFYGIDSDTPIDRIEEDFSDMVEIEEFIKEKVLKNKSINYLELKFATNHFHQLDEKTLKYRNDMRTHITDPDSLFLRRVKLHEKIKALCTGDMGLLHIYESINGDIPEADLLQFAVDHPDYDLIKINDEYEAQYPLIQYLHYYDYKEITGHVAQYINMIDSTLKEKQNV
jgi:hypothetical protein